MNSETDLIDSSEIHSLLYRSPARLTISETVGALQVACASMKSMQRLVALALALFFVLQAAAQPTVSSVRASQTPGTTQVAITYDLAHAQGSNCDVTVEVSADGGATYVSATGANGAVGAGIAPGTGKSITWSAEAQWPEQLLTNVRARVTASDADLTPAGMALIPAGSFQMGDNFAEFEARERPVHTVTLSAFYMGRTEVTWAEWQAVRAWGLANGYTDLPEGFGKAADHPVSWVSWSDIVKWCNAASERDGLVPVYRTTTGGVHRNGTDPLVHEAPHMIFPLVSYANNGYRLPTEAEWEKAARGGLSGRRFPWGDTITHSRANYYSSAEFAYDASVTRGYHPSSQWGLHPYTLPVGSFAANGYGLYDMAGNVSEWCNDWWGSVYYSYTPRSDPLGPDFNFDRVIRGGGGSLAAYNRVAYRNYSSPQTRLPYYGFRLARRL